MEKARPERARFGARLRRLRALKGPMTQDELARRSGVNVDSVRNYEQGKSFAASETVDALAAALRVSPAVFRACKMDAAVRPDDDRRVYAAAHALFGLADACGVRPHVCGSQAGVAAEDAYVEYALCAWTDAIEADRAEAAACASGGAARADGCVAARDERCRAVVPDAGPREEWFILNFNEPFDGDCVPVEPASERLRRLRTRRGFSQARLAEAAGISSFSLGSYEQGRRAINAAHRRALSRALDAAPEALLDFDVPDQCAAVHCLFELAFLLDLRPCRAAEGIVLAPADDAHASSAAFADFVRQWDAAWRRACETSDGAAYRAWMAGFGAQP